MLDRLERELFFQRAFSALASNHIDGDYAEFGCYSGTTFYFAHREARRFRHGCRLWAFDSFQGLPAASSQLDAHPERVPGTVATSLERFHEICRENGIARGDYEVVPGFYVDGLQGWLAPATQDRAVDFETGCASTGGQAHNIGTPTSRSFLADLGGFVDLRPASPLGSYCASTC
jgi:hypothetical protein